MEICRFEADTFWEPTWPTAGYLTIRIEPIMFRTLFLAACVGCLMFTFTNPVAAQEELAIGDKAPLLEYKMTNIDGQSWSLLDLSGKAGMLVIFTCNTCPFVVGREGKSEGWENRYNDVIASARKLGVATVLVNSNEAKRKGDDSLEEMKKHALAEGYLAPYLVDTGHKLADGFGARTTPHVYLFDGEFRLVYRGAIDDNVNAADEVTEHYLQNAIDRMVNGKKVKPAVTKAVGCSIKRVR